MSKEAMKLALDRSEPSILSPGWTLVRDEDIAALREALAAQPAQQFTEDAPADCKRLAEHGAPICGRCHMGPCKYTTPQAQPAREPLTDEQWQIIADTLGCIITREQKDAIEAAHGIKEST